VIGFSCVAAAIVDERRFRLLEAWWELAAVAEVFVLTMLRLKLHCMIRCLRR
jgi:hypothetical protein